MNAAQNQVAGAPVTTSHVLRGAALYLARHGWIQGEFYDSNSAALLPAADVIGALGIAATGRRIESIEDTLERTSPVFDALVALEESLTFGGVNLSTLTGGAPSSCWSDIQAWNDRFGRTANQVIAALRVAADDWDRYHQVPIRHISSTRTAQVLDDI